MNKTLFRQTDKRSAAFQILSHVALAYLIFYGTLAQWATVLALIILSTTLSSILVHRYFTHRAFVAPNWFVVAGSLFLTVVGNLSILGWVAIHRQHHAFTDTEKDPHSPHHHGYIAVQFRAVGRKPTMKYASDLIRNPLLGFLHNYHWALIIGYVVVLWAIDPMAIIYAWLVPAIINWHYGALVNTLNHCPSIGYRNHNTPDCTVNNVALAMITAGEGFHNNHHALPNNANFGEKWFEFDIGYQIIKLIRLDK